MLLKKICVKLIHIAISFALVFNITIYHAAFADDGINIINDAEIEDYTHSILSDVLNANNIDPERVDFYIVKDQAINAFVYDGLKVFVNLGLILNASGPEVVYGVLAHEVGHIKGVHLVRGTAAIQTSAIKSGLIGLTALAIGLFAMPRSANGESLDMVQAAVLAGGQVFQRSVLAFTRGQEEEADKYALDALTKMQISNDGITELFTKLKTIQSRYIQNIDKYSTTHPLSDARIDFFTKYNTTKTKQTKKLQDLKLAHCLINGKINGFFDIKPSITADTSFLTNKQCKSYYAIYKAIGKKNWDLAESLAGKYTTSFPSQALNPYFNETQGDIAFAKSNLQDALRHYSTAIKNANAANKPLFVTRQLLYKSFNTSIALHKNAINLLANDIAEINKELAKAKEQSYQAKLYFLLSVAKQYYGSEVLSLINLAFSKFYSNNKEGAKTIYTKLSTNQLLSPEEKAELETLKILIDDKDAQGK